MFSNRNIGGRIRWAGVQLGGMKRGGGGWSGVGGTQWFCRI